MKKIDPDFDGHIEKPLKEMTPKEKLNYLSNYILTIKLIKKNIKRKEKTDNTL